MQILYRYIFLRAVYASGFVVMACGIIASLINLIDILDKVVNSDVAFDRIWRYLMLTLAPRMVDLLNVMMILAGLMTMGELGRRLELVAMRAAGLSDGRLLNPVLFMAMIASGVVAWAQVDALPRLGQEGDLAKAELKAVGMPAPPESPIYSQIGQSAMQAGAWLSDQKEWREVRLFLFDQGRVSELIHAQTVSQSAQGGWTLRSGFFRKVDPVSGQVLKYEPFEEMPWPERLETPEAYAREAAIRKNRVEWLPLSGLIDQRSFAARQEIHKRIAIAVATGVGLFVGAWFGMKMERFNAARAVCLAILLGFAYRMTFDGFLAIGMELGESWVCHLANAGLAAMVFSATFLTSTSDA